jgi:hypothetical protein
VLDRPPAEAEVDELAACHDPVLAAREPRDRLVVGVLRATNVDVST